MDTVQETIIFLTWTIRDWYLLTELFQITVINCKLALVFSLENPVFLSNFQLSQPFLCLFNLSTNSMSSWSPFPLILHFVLYKAFIMELRDRQQQREQTGCYQDPSPCRRDPFAVEDGIPVAHSHMEKGFMGASVCIWYLPQVYCNEPLVWIMAVCVHQSFSQSFVYKNITLCSRYFS